MANDNTSGTYTPLETGLEERSGLGETEPNQKLNEDVDLVKLGVFQSKATEEVEPEGADPEAALDTLAPEPLEALQIGGRIFTPYKFVAGQTFRLARFFGGGFGEFLDGLSAAGKSELGLADLLALFMDPKRENMVYEAIALFLNGPRALKPEDATLPGLEEPVTPEWLAQNLGNDEVLELLAAVVEREMTERFFTGLGRLSSAVDRTRRLSQNALKRTART